MLAELLRVMGKIMLQEMESVLFAMILIIANWGLFETTKLQWAL